MSPTDAETCSRCGRLLLCSEQACVFGGMIVCAECDRVLRSRQAPQPKAPSPKPAVSAETVAVPFSPAPAQAQPIGSRRTRPVWVVGAIGGGIATICAVVVLVILLKSHGGGGGGTGVIGVFGSPYSADYKIVGGYSAGVEVTVRGPAAKLAVILTDPKGESGYRIVEKDEMISNSQTIQLPMYDAQVGTYVLAVKTVDPEKVVWKKDITFSLNQLMVEDVKFHFEPNRRFMGGLTGDFALVELEIALRKDGNLPVDFTDVSIAVGDANRGFCSFEGDHIMIDQRQTVRVKVSLFATEKMKEEESKRGWRGLPAIYALFWPGDRYLVKGTLFYGKDHKSLDFEKEFVVPAEEVTEKQQTVAENMIPIDIPKDIPSPKHSVVASQKSSQTLLLNGESYVHMSWWLEEELNKNPKLKKALVDLAAGIYEQTGNSIDLVDWLQKGENLWAVGSFGHDARGIVCHSPNNGKTWTRQWQSTGIYEQCQAIGIYFSDSNEGWVLLLGGILHTTDGGASWREISGNKGLLFKNLFILDKKRLAVRSGPVPRFSYTEDGGLSWKRSKEGEKEYDKILAELEKTFNIEFPRLRYGKIYTKEENITNK